ncbi:MAG: hypothetical protein WB696_10405 [Chthoniobacterales bacterium]
MALTSAPNLRYVGMCIGDENIWVSCPGVQLPERQLKKPSSILRLIKRLKKRPESFHIVAEPGRELDLFELDVSIERLWLFFCS